MNRLLLAIAAMYFYTDWHINSFCWLKVSGFSRLVISYIFNARIVCEIAYRSVFAFLILTVVLFYIWLYIFLSIVSSANYTTHSSQVLRDCVFTQYIFRNRESTFTLRTSSVKLSAKPSTEFFYNPVNQFPQARLVFPIKLQQNVAKNSGQSVCFISDCN